MIVKVLQHRFDTLVGSIASDDWGRRWLDPFDPKLSLDLEVVGGEDIPDGHYVVVAVERSAKRRTPVESLTVDVHADWAFARDMSVQLKVNNLSDQMYETVYGYNQPGRGVFLTVRWQPK